MILPARFKTAEIPIEKIDHGNKYFKLSRNIIDEKLERSVRESGMLEPPALLKKKGGYAAMTGHNRIAVLKRLGISSAVFIILKKPDYDFFLSNALLKCRRNEMGPIGKIRLLIILKNFFNLDKDALSGIARIIDLPPDIINENDAAENITALPDSLKDYLDYRDISIRTIKIILRLPPGAARKLDEWTRVAHIRVNIFRGIVEFMSDIHKMNPEASCIYDFDLESIEDRKAREIFLYSRLFRERYPEYSDLKDRADALIKSLNGNGIKVEFPEYFEGDEIGLRLTVKKNDDIDMVRNRISKINPDDIKKLLELL